MKTTISLLFLIFIGFPASTQENMPNFEGKINDISFEGLTTTKESYLKKIISTQEGNGFDSTTLKQDLFLLRNLNLFFSVNFKVSNPTNDVVHITFIIREARYLYPIISASGFKDQLKLQIGANHINFLGRAQSFGALYQFYDRHSISVFHTANRHSNSKTGHLLAIAKYSTIEPLYAQDTVSQFNFDNYSISVGGHYWINQYLNLGIGGSYMYEDYTQRDLGFIINNGQNKFNFHKHQLRSSVNFNEVDNQFERLSGFKWQVYGEWIHTYLPNKMGASPSPPAFIKATFDYIFYKSIKKNGNFAVKSRLGISTNHASPFAPFVLDGFQNVRGIGNRVERGTAEFIFNIEYRHTILRNKYTTIQAAIFSDYGSLRSPGSKISKLFHETSQNLFTGGGLRFHLNVLYKTSLRIDYSATPFAPNTGGFTFGFGQFF
ncbi:MAG: hypothetical protein MK066_03700 [Crocinitomicaceae bacterium]|nr:hypothetical protein [Crocinitomicaceae bacterium]